LVPQIRGGESKLRGAGEKKSGEETRGGKKKIR